MAQNKGGLVCHVEPGSAAEYLGINPGDRVVSINGNILRDELDFRFHSSAENVTLGVVTTEGKSRTLEIEKDPDDLMGLSFESPVFDSIRTCKNNCVFCFISQLPPRLRRSLYLRDDDYRLSFLFGNFISLTHLSREDWERIFEQRLSPLRISLHTSNPDLRAHLMGSPDAAKGMENLRRLQAEGISFHIQIVLLKGVNDGDGLLSTLDDLRSLGAAVLSVGVVPAVYTKYRKVFPSGNTDPVWARRTLELVEDYAQGVYKERGVRWVYGADEFYITAGKEFPAYDHYDDFPQFENGIGMVANFRQEMKSLIARGKVRGARMQAKTVLAVTGHMAYPEIVDSVKGLGMEDRILPVRVRNSFFGDRVTCAGLLTGRDILSALSKNKDFVRSCDTVLIPSYCVHEDRFLDDVTVDTLSAKLKVPVKVVEPSPDSLFHGVMGSEEV